VKGHYDHGPEALLPQIGPSREFSGLLALTSHDHAVNGRRDRALADAVRLRLLAAHLEPGEAVLSHEVASEVIARSRAVLLELAADATPEDRRAIAAAVDAAPRLPAAADALRAEGRHFHAYLSAAAAAARPERLIRRGGFLMSIRGLNESDAQVERRERALRIERAMPRTRAAAGEQVRVAYDLAAEHVAADTDEAAAAARARFEVAVAKSTLARTLVTDPRRVLARAATEADAERQCRDALR